ncbi:response regulator transcription factor [Aquabacterium sp.]|uniref:response regulator n=1 Tax=Aquabacterium sp. TaxID=1872578 RepID=UPI002487EA0F|nr:response regulator transcription factor [Aquabacterium sp.]MDI1260469.1 response regulator transcription factor [Aquabacterium sp.]
MSTQPSAVRGDAYLIVDDHALIREGIVRVFSDTRPQARLFEASSLQQAIETLQGEHGPSIDTVLLDLHLPDSRGLETLQRIKAVAPNVVVGVVSGTDDDQLAMQCLQQGAAAFVPKHGDLDQFVQGISAMASGGIYFPRELLWQVSGRLSVVDKPAALSASLVRLTPRQGEVLRLLLKGFSNQVISNELGISSETVKLHVSALLRAHKVSSRVHLILACANPSPHVA